MNKTSFLDIMRALNKEELKRFEAFLNSPYFNTRNNVVNLFSSIKKYAPEFTHKMLDKEEVWKKLFPGKKYNYGILKNIIYDITKLAERFLEVEDLNYNEMQRMQNLLNKLGEKHLENIFLNKYNTFEKNFLKSSKFYDNFFQRLCRTESSQIHSSGLQSKPLLKINFYTYIGTSIFDFIVKFGNNFNNVYIEEAEHNQSSSTEFIRLFSKTIFNDKTLEEYFNKMNAGSDRNFKISNIFFRMIKCYMNPESTELYFEFKKTLFENDKYISEAALRGLYACLGSTLDNCKDLSKINKNRELFELICHLNEKNIFLSAAGKVIPSLYLLAVKTAGALKETAFIEKMISEFLPRINPDLLNNFTIFSRTFLYFSKNEFDKSMEFSNKLSIDSFQMKYILKNLQIIISFEKDDFIMFQYLSDAHKHFLSNNKSVSSSYKESNMKFLNYTNSLFKLRESKNKTEIGFTERKIHDDTFVNKQWLIEKLKEIRLTVNS
ncbi:MAG: hypothetical protein IPI04_03740 [Ignavibacteria bacterium]|nr:hypothetical protein [Ignavibacteria bacterium]